MPTVNRPQLRLSGSSWTSSEDFYNAFLALLGAPEWHGHNLDALHDSIVTGAINSIEVPYLVVIEGLNTMALPAREMVDRFAKCVREWKTRGCEIDIVCEP